MDAVIYELTLIRGAFEAITVVLSFLTITQVVRLAVEVWRRK